MNDMNNTPIDENELSDEVRSAPEQHENKLVRLIKTIAVNPDRGTTVDEHVVNVRYYNAFNYSLLSAEHQETQVTIGITSPNRGDGKTLVACNLAVSLALGLQRKTVLVDLNTANPTLHEVFGVAEQPGLSEAFTNGKIHVSRTVVEHLSVLSAGSKFGYHPGLFQSGVPSRENSGECCGNSPSLPVESIVSNQRFVMCACE